MLLLLLGYNYMHIYWTGSTTDPNQAFYASRLTSMLQMFGISLSEQKAAILRNQLHKSNMIYKD